jgi:carbonic anhydrase
VGVLKVPHIVICGHTDCGAIKGALAPDQLGALPHLREWLGFMRAAVEIVAATSEGMDEKARTEYLLEQNVLLQLAHLKTHPTVAVAMAKNELKLHGWVYNIGTGQVVAFNEDTGRFEDVEDRYATQVKKHFDEFHPHD